MIPNGAASLPSTPMRACGGSGPRARSTTPKGTLTMLLFAIPVSLAYLLGLGILWVVTLGGRRVSRKSEGEAAD